jgi:hypothetical protein
MLKQGGVVRSANIEHTDRSMVLQAYFMVEAVGQLIWM